MRRYACMSVIDLEELKKYLSSEVVIKKYYMASYDYDKRLKGLLVELNGTYFNLFIPTEGSGYFRLNNASSVLSENHPFGKIFLVVEDCFLELFTPRVEGMVI